MSFAHMAWAMQSKIGDPLAKLLLVALADRADKETGQCWPSLARLSEDTEISLATISRKLNYLEDHNFISRFQRDQKSTLYTLSHSAMTLSHSETPPYLTVRDEPISNNLSKNQNNTIINAEFEDFWALYPRKVGKGAARKAFKAALSKATVEELRGGLQAYCAKLAGVDPTYIKHPSTWLNGECWLDDDQQTGWGNLNEL